MMNAVSLTKAESYDPIVLAVAIERHFELLKLDELITPTKKILIKPNLLMSRKPGAATTTHPEVVAAIVRALQMRGITDITLADSSGGPYNASLMKAVYQSTGMAEIAKNTGIKLNMDFSSETVNFSEGKRCKQFQIITPALQCDMIINVGKLKTHAMTGLSAACKNLFGLVPGLIKPEMHCRFPEKAHFGEMLNDLCEYAKPAVNFVDGILAMQGNGPSGGEPRALNVIVAGRNAHYVDRTICSIIHMDAHYPVTLDNAIARNLAPENISDVILLGDDIDNIRVNDFKLPDSHSTDFIDMLPKFMRGFMSNRFTPKPVIRTKECIGCAKCKESCPQDTIDIVNKKAIIKYDNCIKCYCCHEMCPVKAIDIKRSKLFNF